MEEKRPQTESRVVRMQKLRRAVDRLRNLRSTTEPQEAQPPIWIRLKNSLLSRLGIGAQKDDTSE